MYGLLIIVLKKERLMLEMDGQVYHGDSGVK